MAKSAQRRKEEAKRKLGAALPTPPACGARKRNGKPCKREAGWGTSHPGRGKCKLHGGASKSHRDKAVRDEVNGMARPISVSPASALETVLHLAAGQLAYATWKVGELTDDELVGSDGYHEWFRLQRLAMSDVAKFAKISADAGIDERLALVAERRTEQMAQFLDGVMSQLNLTGEQRKLVGPAIRKTMATIEGQVSEPDE